jgi:hypothetical protein
VCVYVCEFVHVCECVCLRVRVYMCVCMCQFLLYPVTNADAVSSTFARFVWV